MTHERALTRPLMRAYEYNSILLEFNEMYTVGEVDTGRDPSIFGKGFTWVEFHQVVDDVPVWLNAKMTG